MVRLRAAVLASLAVLFSTTSAISTTSAAGFLSEDGTVGFALNVPQADDDNDLYFTFNGPSSSSWIAVGMGSSQMDNSLIFMMYADSTGTNITLSPRYGGGNYEPEHTKDVIVHVMPGSQVVNGRMTANVRCEQCLTWPGGSVDTANTKAPFMFARGPEQDFTSNSVSASVKRHAHYGSFTLDLTKALGTKAVPNADYADSAGTVQLSAKDDKDLAPPFHAFFMLFAFVGVMPIGVLILRILDRPKWHGINQAISVLLALAGVGLGFYIGTLYQRTRSFTSAHQIFGIIIMAMLIGELIVGFLHHRMYMLTRIPTILTKIHIWIGRVVISCGIANGFLGFPLALNRKYNWALLILVGLVLGVAAPFLFWRYRRNIQKKRTASGVRHMEDTGYEDQPWNSGMPTHSFTDLRHMQNYPLQNTKPQQGR
ncbi:hypothetical protein BJ878DRAFT_523882 [Calycina marina]|uniref:DOMON domain-containing protein n=1 Tax=Calycina marina TaxID=1763456 RepID=A0A9P8CBQ2_9HELO|nr:hypothetical protein BJ878DRAFT_523882 [Calycina marina]